MSGPYLSRGYARSLHVARVRVRSNPRSCACASVIRARVGASGAGAGKGALAAGPHGLKPRVLGPSEPPRRRDPLKRSTHRAPFLSLDRHVRRKGTATCILPKKPAVCLGVHLVRERSLPDAMNADRGVRPLVTSALGFRNNGEREKE